MYHLKAINKYFWKYRTRLLLGVLFIVLSNYFRILSPQLSGYVVDKVAHAISQQQHKTSLTGNIIKTKKYDVFVQYVTNKLQASTISFENNVIICGIILLALAILSGIFMFFMRQTIIVMSRYIEYEQKNEIYNHYQKLDTAFYKTHSTGDLMNRITEDVSRIRMYTGPALMYIINLAATIGFSLYFMLSENWRLTLYVLSPLPILTITIYYVNTIINRKSERIQALLSDLTTTAQESYSGIRVIKSFVQEFTMIGFFTKNSQKYRKNAIGLAKVESIYFPAMALLIGLSTLLTIAIGCWYYIHNRQYNVSAGTITEFIIYINMLTFPVSAIGWTASMVQRASVSQRRINEFLQTEPEIFDDKVEKVAKVDGDIVFDDVTFTYPHTGITAIQHFNLIVKKGEKVLVLGRTGSGKSTIAQLLLRFYNPSSGKISIGERLLYSIPLQQLRQQVSYVPQDVFLFSETVANNISFGLDEMPPDEVIQQTASFASVHNDINWFSKKYNTLVGERGVTLSGGQKQRISIARALIKNHEIIVFDDCLSAVDSKTENEIIHNLNNYLHDKTTIIITHRIFTSFHFDKIVVLEDGKITEEGTHEALLENDGYYAELYRLQVTEVASGGVSQPFDK